MYTVRLDENSMKNDDFLKSIVSLVAKEALHNIEIEMRAEKEYQHKTKIFSQALKKLMGAKAPVHEWDSPDV